MYGVKLKYFSMKNHESSGLKDIKNINSEIYLIIMADILTKLCIISTALGIILLIIVSDKVGPPKSSISSITERDINKAVVINGMIESITNKGSALALLEVRDSKSSITVVAFKPEENNIKKGDFVEISGRVSVYKNNLQIIADSIES